MDECANRNGLAVARGLREEIGVALDTVGGKLKLEIFQRCKRFMLLENIFSNSFESLSPSKDFRSRKRQTIKPSLHLILGSTVQNSSVS